MHFGTRTVATSHKEFSSQRLEDRSRASTRKTHKDSTVGAREFQDVGSSRSIRIDLVECAVTREDDEILT